MPLVTDLSRLVANGSETFQVRASPKRRVQRFHGTRKGEPESSKKCKDNRRLS
jgi:hypothetical protein